MASTLINKPYSDRAVDILLKIIQQGNQYDVEIDGNPVISRTDDTEIFYDFVDFIVPSTQFVAFRIYKGNSRNYDRTVLIMPQNSLNGFPMQEAKDAYKPKIDIDKEKSDWEKDKLIENLTEEVEYLTKKVKTIKRKAEEKIQETKDKQNTLSGMLETIAPAAIQVLANSKLSQTYPALGMLGNINEPQQPQETNYNPPVSEVKFSAEASEPTLTAKQQKQLNFFKELEKNFEEFELVAIFEFLKRAAKDKDLLENLIPKTEEF